ncbi:MAG TPA: hypothetical protein VE869_00085, partial [Gemmatimonas sp.]|nr:hypothetical protein [Gemmatimonas sp.]
DSAAAIAAIVTGSAPVAVLQCDGILPVSRGSLDGILVQHGDPRYMAAATVALRALGRLVAPSQAAVPSGIVELARDDLHWVGERSADSSDEITDVAGNAPLVQLRRRR